MSVEANMPPVNARADIRRATLFGIAGLAILVGTVGMWAATAPLAGAVITSGRMVAESNVRRLQHPTGGVISQIHVRDGDHVQAGQVLVRLDDTQTRASLALIDNELLRFLARKARLDAQRDGLNHLDVKDELRQRQAEPVVQEAVAAELALLRSSLGAAQVQRDQLRERITQAHEEIVGLTAQIEARRVQSGIILTELEGVEHLYEKDLVSLARLSALQREASQLDGENGSLTADIARARGRIAEIELQILQIDEDASHEVATEMRDVEGKIADLRERRIAARDQLTYSEMRAPQTGFIHEQTVHTIGGVINPAEPIMLIIPEDGGLVVEARIEPSLIDRVHVGQAATLRFPAFNAAETPDLAGHVIHVSADISTDKHTGMSYYTARLSLAVEEAQRLAGKTLVPGMPVEAFIETGSRTALAYLIKPVRDQLNRSFRHD